MIQLVGQPHSTVQQGRAHSQDAEGRSGLPGRMHSTMKGKHLCALCSKEGGISVPGGAVACASAAHTVGSPS